MKTKFVKSDIFDTDCQVICHQVNGVGSMSSGIAETIRSLYPEVYNEYIKDFSAYGDLLMGSCKLIDVSNASTIRFIANLYGQYLYMGAMELNEVLNLPGHKMPDYWSPSNGVRCMDNSARYTNYEWFYRGLETLAYLMISNGLTSVAFPYRIGSDRGGADWNVILSMIESVFSRYNDIEVKIYQLK